MPHAKFFWDEIEDNVVREYDENNNTIAHCTTEPTLYGSVLTQNREGEVRHYHFDGQGNTAELTDQSGNVTDTRRYSAFGQIAESTGTTVFSREWGGASGYLRNSSPEYYIRGRAYFPSAGRWSSREPIVSYLIYNHYQLRCKSPDRDAVLAAQNLYRYCNNRPLDLYDPQGAKPLWTHPRDVIDRFWPYKLSGFYICRDLILPGPKLTDKCGRACGAKHCDIGFEATPGNIVLIRHGRGGAQNTCNKGKGNACPLYLDRTGVLGAGSAKQKSCANAQPYEIEDCVRSYPQLPGIFDNVVNNCQTDVKNAATHCCLTSWFCFLPSTIARTCYDIGQYEIQPAF